MCALAVSRLLAMLHLRYGRLRSHLTLRALYLCSLLFVLIVGVARLPMLNPVNREAVPFVHTLRIFLSIRTHTLRTFFVVYFLFTLRIFFVVYFLFTLLYLSRESRQKRFSNSATREAAKWGSVEMGPQSRFPCNRASFN